MGLLLQLSQMRAREALSRELRAAASRLPDLFSPDALLVVGFSGGQDSTALLHALANRHPPPRLTAIHVDHALRPESDAEAARVAAIAADLGVDFDVQRVDVASYRRAQPSWSIQAAARAARYHALGHAAQARAATAVVVAHTADDQAETVLLRLLRGAGIDGLAAMRLNDMLDPRQLGPTPAEWLVAAPPFRLARPLLKVARSITLAYCAELKLSVVEDPSNQSRAYTRNRVRHDLLPVLEAFNPAIRSVLTRTADLVAEDVAALELVTAELERTLLRTASDTRRAYDLRVWRGQPRALQRRLLRRGLGALLGTLVDVGARPIDDALQLLASGSPGAAYHLPYGVDVRVETEVFQLITDGQARRPSRARKIGEVGVSRV